MKFSWKQDSKRIIVICVAAFVMALNIKTFVRTGGLYPGGATGLTILLQTIFERFLGIAVPYTVINLLLNSVPVYIGFRFIGKKFTVYSCVMIVLTSFLTDMIPGYVITYDILLISIFGGIINGLVISLCLMMNATTGGTDFISIYLSEKKGMDSWNLILALNIVILSIAGILFGWDKALYSIIFQYASTQVLHVLYKRYQKQTFFIVTKKAEEICDAIYKVSNHGATILEGKGSYEHCERNVVYSVVSREEVKKVLQAVKAVDEEAFINEVKTEGLSGRFYQKPAD
ncbi:MAG: YitT family protein [Lachnospiraceae bacterium]|nr:YitT family protein [Lachnospiraceae bacterium]